MDTTWMPYMWPIKTCLLIGIIFLLIQGVSELFKKVIEQLKKVNGLEKVNDS